MNHEDEIIILELDEPDDAMHGVVDEEYSAPRTSRLTKPVLVALGILLGAAITAAAAWYLRPAAFDAEPLRTEISSLKGEIAALKAEPAPVMPTVNLRPLTRRIEALEARPTVDPLSEESVARMEALQADGFELPDLPDMTLIESRLAELQTQVDALKAAPPMIVSAQAETDDEPYIDPDTLPRFPELTLRDGAAQLAGSGFARRLFSRHVRVRGTDSPDRLIDLIAADLEAGQPRAALATFDRLPPRLATLARGWRADMEDALEANTP